MRIGFLCWMLVALLLPAAAKAQDLDAEFEKLVLQGIHAHQGTFLSALAPTLEDCKAVFKGNGADLVMAFSKSMFAEMQRDGAALSEKFVDLRTAHFSSEEALSNREAVTGGMKGIREYLLPGIVFYQVTYLREAGAEFGVTYRYFVKVGDHWVFFPKPWRAFDGD